MHDECVMCVDDIPVMLAENYHILTHLPTQSEHFMPGQFPAMWTKVLSNLNLRPNKQTYFSRNKGFPHKPRFDNKITIGSYWPFFTAFLLSSSVDAITSKRRFSASVTVAARTIQTKRKVMRHPVPPCWSMCLSLCRCEAY